MGRVFDPFTQLPSHLLARAWEEKQVAVRRSRAPSVAGGSTQAFSGCAAMIGGRMAITDSLNQFHFEKPVEPGSESRSAAFSFQPAAL